MKIIPLHRDIKSIIKRAVKNDRIAQRMIYDQYSSKMLSVCRSYVKDNHFAEDVMLKGFLKVFKNLSKFKHKGSFEGWVRKIMIRESIDYLRVGKKLDFTDQSAEEQEIEALDEIKWKDETEYVQHILDYLPAGYRTIFNLSVIEEFSHKEIAKTLDITESTSRSQLFKARQMLRKQFNKGKKTNER